MTRLIALCLLALPFAQSCTSYSEKLYLGSDDYELARHESPDGTRETFTVQNGRDLHITTNYERERPFLGLKVKELNKDRATRRGVKPYSGLLVTGTYPDSSARQGGVREGDVLMSLDGKETVYVEQLSSAEGQLSGNQEVALMVLRGENEMLDLKLRTNLLREQVTDRQDIVLESAPNNPRPYAGVNLRGIPSAWSEKIFGDQRNAILVSEVEVGSPAWLAGVRGGDLIEAVDGGAVPSLADLSHTIAAKGQAGATTTWRVRREAGRVHDAEIALWDYSGTSRFSVPLLFSSSNGVYEDRWRLGLGLIMGNRNSYDSDQSTRVVKTRNVFSALLGLIRVDSQPTETRVRLLWFIHINT